jgi:hypothetical protein
MLYKMKIILIFFKKNPKYKMKIIGCVWHTLKNNLKFHIKWIKFYDPKRKRIFVL